MKKIIRSCIKCRRMNAKPMEQFMGSLPGARLEAYHPPFTFTGVDLFGPLTVVGPRNREKMGLSVYLPYDSCCPPRSDTIP